MKIDLLKALRNRDLELLEETIDQDRLVIYQKYDMERTLIHFGITRSYVEGVQLLLDKGMDPNYMRKDKPLLWWTILHKNLKIFKILLQYNANPLWKIGLCKLPLIHHIVYGYNKCSKSTGIAMLQAVLDISLPKAKTLAKQDELLCITLKYMYAILSSYLTSNKIERRIIALNKIKNFAPLQQDLHRSEGEDKYNHNEFLTKLSDSKDNILSYWQSKCKNKQSLSNTLLLCKASLTEKQCTAKESIAMCVHLFKEQFSLLGEDDNIKNLQNLASISRLIAFCKKTYNKKHESDYYTMLGNYYTKVIHATKFIAEHKDKKPLIDTPHI